MKKTMILLTLTLLMSACIKSDVESELEGKVDEILAPYPSVENINIKNSSANLKWKVEYSRALDDVYEHPDLDSLFSASLNVGDLNLVKCRNFALLSRNQKKVFYTVYLAAIAEAESDFKTGIKTTNPGDNTTNVGLLQIDITAARNHTKGALGSMVEDSLTDARLNLQVGAFVLKNQINSNVAKNRLFPAQSYYWSVLTAKARVLRNIESNRANLKFCL